jgi:hypothetical protein
MLGSLWMGLCGLPGVIYLWLLLHGAVRGVVSPLYFLPALLCLLYLAGGVAGVFMFCGARWGRRLAGLTAALIVAATITASVAFRAIPVVYYVVGAFAALSLVQLFLPRHDSVAATSP